MVFCRLLPFLFVTSEIGNMAARAIWKGNLKLNSTKVQVKLYSAVQDKTVRFHVLDDRALMRVKQHMVDDEELKSLEPEPSRDIEVTQFVPTKAIPPEFYDRPYYVGPDGNEEAYFALAEALSNQNKEGIARWVMRNQPYVGAWGAVGDHLLLFTLRNAEEVLSSKDLPRPAGRAPDKRELSMAKQLVEMLEGEFNPEDFKDEYRQRVMEFIEQKAKGKAPKLRAVKTKRAPSSLDAVLAKSIESLKKGKRAA